MTTHDEKSTDTPAGPVPQAPRPADEAAAPPADAGPPAAEKQPQAAGPKPQPSAQPAAESASAAQKNDSLFVDEDRSGLRSRWDELQAAFVDDPKQCVVQADTLVKEVVDQLTAGFTDARSRLEAQWSRGETASTEDLRVALTRYRDFFQRLLSV